MRLHSKMLAGNRESVRSLVSKRHALERAHVDQAQRKSSLGHQPRLQTARRTHQQHLRAMALLKRARHGQSRNDVPARSAAGDEDAQFRVHSS